MPHLTDNPLMTANERGDQWTGLLISPEHHYCKNDPWINGISLRLWTPPSTSTPTGIGAKGPERGGGREGGQEYQRYEDLRDETLVGVPATEGAHFSRISTWTKALTASLHSQRNDIAVKGTKTWESFGYDIAFCTFYWQLYCKSRFCKFLFWV